MLLRFFPPADRGVKIIMGALALLTLCTAWLGLAPGAVNPRGCVALLNTKDSYLLNRPGLRRSRPVWVWGATGPKARTEQLHELRTKSGICAKVSSCRCGWWGQVSPQESIPHTEERVGGPQRTISIWPAQLHCSRAWYIYCVCMHVWGLEESWVPQLGASDAGGFACTQYPCPWLG